MASNKITSHFTKINFKRWILLKAKIDGIRPYITTCVYIPKLSFTPVLR